MAGAMGLGSMGMLAGAGIGGLAIGGAVALGKGISEAKQYRLAMDDVYKQLHLSKDAQAVFNAKLEKTAHALGQTRLEYAQTQKAYLQYVGAVQGPGQIQDQTHKIGRLALGMGTDVGATTRQFGAYAQAGVFGTLAGNNGMKLRDFAELLAEAIAKGRMRGREGELMQSIQTLVGVQLQTLTRPQNMAGMFDMLNAMNASGEPGLQGMRGAQLLAQISQGIQNPGGNLGEFLQFKAFGGGDYFEYQKRKEEGPFGDHDNLQKILNHYRMAFPEANVRHFALSKHLGISMNQAEAMDKMRMDSNTRNSFMNTILAALGGGKENQDLLNRLDYTKLPLLAEISQMAGKPQGLRSLLRGERIGFSDRKVEGILSNNDPVATALKEVAMANINQTEGEKLQSSLSEIQNMMTGISDKLLPKLITGVELISDTLTGISNILKKVADFFGVTFDKAAQAHKTARGDNPALQLYSSRNAPPKVSEMAANMDLMYSSRNAPPRAARKEEKAPKPVPPAPKPVKAAPRRIGPPGMPNVEDDFIDMPEVLPVVPKKVWKDVRPYPKPVDKPDQIRNEFEKAMVDEIIRAKKRHEDRKKAAKQKANTDGVTVEHSTHIYIDGVKKTVQKGKAVGNGSAYKTQVQMAQ